MKKQRKHVAEAGRPDISKDLKQMSDLEHLTLLHLMMMVYRDISFLGSAKKEFPKILIEEIQQKLRPKDASENDGFENHKVTAILRRRPDDNLSKNIYDEIYRILNTDNEDGPFYYLHEQCSRLKGHSGKDTPEKYAQKLWMEMRKRRELIDKSYLEVFRQMSPWLFVGRDLESFDPEQTYKLITVAIAISLNLKTSNEIGTDDALDELCKSYLSAGPAEQLPEFSMRELFDTLFPPAVRMLAVKRSGEAYYDTVKREDLTDQDRLNILLPRTDMRYDLYPFAEAEAGELLDNQIGDENRKRVLGFFEYFRDRYSSYWPHLVDHISESFAKVNIAHKMEGQAFSEDIIREELKKPFQAEDLAAHSIRIHNILKQNVPWITTVCTPLCEEINLGVTLPTNMETEEDAVQLYRCIAAYILIAVYCLALDPNGTSGSSIPEKRRQFRIAMRDQIGRSFAENESEIQGLRRENEELRTENDRLKTKPKVFDRRVAQILQKYLRVVLSQLNPKIVEAAERVLIFELQEENLYDDTVRSMLDTVLGRENAQTDSKQRRLTPSSDMGIGGNN